MMAAYDGDDWAGAQARPRVGYLPAKGLAGVGFGGQSGFFDMSIQIRRASAREGKRRSVSFSLICAARVTCERLEERTLFSITTLPDNVATTAGVPVVITGPSLLA